MFHPISKHREVVEKTRCSLVFFNQLQGVWISDETPFRMFDIASKPLIILGENQSKSSPNCMMINITYPNLLNGCNSFVFSA